jgi:uncharacterized protein YoaH (UPF0181 family)
MRLSVTLALEPQQQTVTTILEHRGRGLSQYHSMQQTNKQTRKKKKKEEKKSDEIVGA